MARFLVLAASAPLMLIGAAYPGDKPGAMPADDRAYVEEAPVTYRPCRPGAGDDRCIQLYERGVRTAYAQWLRAHDLSGQRTEVAMGGPVESAADHPRREYSERGHHRRGHGGDRRHRCHGDDGAADHDYGDEARGM